MIKVVLFDFGGVLTTSGTKGFIGRTVAALYGLPPEQVDIGDLHALLRRGRMTDEAFFAELNRRYHGNVTKEMFVAAAALGSEPSMEVYDLAQVMRAHGLRTAIFSNVFAMNAEQLRKLGRYDGFDPVILSCEEGYAKPDREFYAVAVDKTGVLPQEILLIDDQEKSLAPAEAMGMHTIRAVAPGQIVADTKALLRRENGLEL